MFGKKMRYVEFANFSADFWKHILRCWTLSQLSNRIFRIFFLDPLKNNSATLCFPRVFLWFSYLKMVIGRPTHPGFHRTSQAAREQRRALEGRAQQVAVLQGGGAPLQAWGLSLSSSNFMCKLVRSQFKIIQIATKVTQVTCTIIFFHIHIVSPWKDMELYGIITYYIHTYTLHTHTYKYVYVYTIW